MPHRTLAVVVSCAVLLTAALVLASCGPETALNPTTKQAVTTQGVTTEISRESTTSATARPRPPRSSHDDHLRGFPASL